MLLVAVFAVLFLFQFCLLTNDRVIKNLFCIFKLFDIVNFIYKELPAMQVTFSVIVKSSRLYKVG